MSRARMWIQTAMLVLLPVLLQGCNTGWSEEPEGVPEAVPGRAGGLRILAWNVHHGAGLDRALDLPRIAAVIERQRPDVVALQEIDEGCGRTGAVDQARRLGALTGMHAVFGPFMDYDGGRYGMALLSRHPVEATWNHRLPDGAEPRTALAARIRLRDSRRAFLFVGVHFYATQDERLAQARSLLHQLAGPSLPIVVAGDFNSRPGSRVMELFVPRFEILQKSGAALTFPANRPDREIDYVLVTRGGALVPRTHLVMEEGVASDHRPILATFDWR